MSQNLKAEGPGIGKYGMKRRERETVNPFSPAPRVVVLKISPEDSPAYQGTFANVWNALELFQPRGCYWHLESEVQGCYQAGNSAQDPR